LDLLPLLVAIQVFYFHEIGPCIAIIAIQLELDSLAGGLQLL
jgi:hypothetical protein